MFLVELVGIVEVVPDAVKASGQSCEWVEECVAHPDGQDGIFLSAGLCRTYGVAIASAHPATCSELYGAGQYRTQGN